MPPQRNRRTSRTSRPYANQQRVSAAAPTFSPPKVSLDLLGNEEASALRIAILVALGLSLVFNKRNSESPWYPLWGQAFSEVIGRTPNLAVAAQYCISFFKPQTAETPQPANQQPQLADENNADAPDEDIFADSASNQEEEEQVTVPLKKGKGTSVITDFAVLHITANKSNGPDSELVVTVENVPILVELKPGPSRGLEAEAFEKSLADKLEHAKKQVVRQAAYLFATKANAKSIRLIAGSGPWWSGAVVSRKLFDATLLQTLRTQDLDRLELKKLKWTRILHVSESMKELKRFCSEIHRLQAMEP